HSAVRAARRVGRLDHHPAPALGPVAGLDDAVVGQVEDRARSITLRARRLVHRLVVLCLVDVSTTPITAGPRALTHLRRAGHFHHEPRRALIAAGHADPEAVGWIEVTQPDLEFAETGTGAFVEWECDVY